MTLAELLRERAREHGDRPFLFWHDETISYRQLYERACLVAEALGAGPGDTVGIQMSNSPAYVETLFGIWTAGATAVPINPALTAEETQYISRHARLRTLLAEKGSATASEARGRSPVASTDAGGSADAASLGYNVASLIYTSGTTGRPKGVMLTHDNYLWDAQAAIDAIGMTAEDRFLCILPLFHVNAQVVTVICPLLAGAQTVLLPRFSPDTFLSDVARYRATAFSAVPTVYAILLERAGAADVSSLRFGLCGAAPMPVEVFERFEQRFAIPIVEGYGLSEATCVSSVNPIRGTRKAGSIGVPLAGQAMKLVDVQDGVGEIVVQGPNVMAGYYDDPEGTAAALRDGWLHTGDLGTVDEDGYFTIVGRKKDMIIRGGENVYPREVEEVLHRHPEVREAVVVGVPDPIWGEQVAAVIVGTLSTDGVQTWCRQHLAAFKCPTRIVHVDPQQIPRTPTGKVQKNRVRDMLAQGGRAELRSASTTR